MISCKGQCRLAGKKKITEDYGSPPTTLNGHPFYGFELDPQQQDLAEKIWSPDYDIIMCNAAAGSGKTLVALGVANLLVQYRRYNEVIYLVSPTQEQKIGYRPGNTEDKLAPYFMPLYDAAVNLGINPYTDINICTEDWSTQKEGYISCMSPIFLRGRNIESDKILIIDECQNLYFDELKTTLTRVHDGAKVIVIGHTGQCDLYHNPERSGFAPYLRHFAGHDRCAVCELSENHRGWISKLADELSF